ncbi:MAG: thioredoxin family protein [Planctomycetota bacterium]
MLRSAVVFSSLALLSIAQEPVTQEPVTQDRVEPAKDSLWFQDFAKAKAQAKAENKDLLIDFTGSDWCGWCVKLDEEVFSQDAFKTAAPKSFVLVKLDYPRNKELLSAEITAQNKKLRADYPVQGFPTILLTDAEGRPYGATGYAEGGPEKYLESLAELKKKGEPFAVAMKDAAGKKGGERATALDAALATLDAELVDAYHLTTMQEIVKLDADGKLNLKAKYETKAKDIAEQREIEGEANMLQELIGPHMEAGEGDKALAKVEEVVKAPKSKIQHQLALFFKGMIIMDTSHDAKAAVASLELAKSLLPESPIAKRIDEVLPDIKKQAPADEGKEPGKAPGKAPGTAPGK